MTENEQSIAHPSDQEMKESSGPTVQDQEVEADAAEQGTAHVDNQENGNDTDHKIPEVNQQNSEEVGNDHVLEAPSDAAEEMLQEAAIVSATDHPVDEVENEEPGTRSEQPQHGEYEEVATDDVEELPLEPEEMENMPETVDEQTYEEEQQLDEYVLGYEQEYVQDEQEYAQDEQDYGYDVEDADHGDLEPDFDQLADHDEDNGNTGVDEVVHEKDAGDAEQGGSEENNDPATGLAIDETQNDADADQDRDVVPSATAPDSSSKEEEDGKKIRRPISWNDWKGVDEKPKQTEVKGPASGKMEAAIVEKVKPKEPAETNDSKTAKKRSRSRSPAKPNPSTQANGTKDGRSSSKGRSAEKVKERSKSADRSNPAKKQQTEAVRSDARRTSSPPRRSQLMGPGPVIKGRLVRGPPGAHPIMGPPARLIAVRRPIAAGPGMPLGRRQSPPPGFLPRGLVPVMPLRAAPLRAGLQPGEVLIPQLAPRRASFPPGRAPPGLEARFLGPPSIASDMATVRLAGPRDMQIVHVPREQLRTLRPVRDLREAEALRGAPPGMVKGPVGMRPGGPVLARPGRESVAVLREPPRDPGPNRGGQLMGPRDNFRMPVPPEMHGRLQGSVRQSPPRDERGQMRSASAPLHAPRGLDDPGRHRHGPTLLPSRRPPSPHRSGPPSRNSPPRMGPAPSASLRRPAEPTNRPHSPPSKRSRHEPMPISNIPHRHPSNIPGPPGHPLSPRGSHPPNSSQRPSAALPSQRGPPPNTNGRMMSSVQVAPPRMAGPPPQRKAPIHVVRDERGRPGDERGRMQSGIPARARSPPRRDDRREQERREQERREQERREQERREQERREQERREQERREQERREQERQANMRRENERREQERREQERREQERREQERRSSSQRQASNSRSALPSSRDDSRRMQAHTQQPQRSTAPGRSTQGAGGRVGVVAGRGMGAGSMAGSKGSGGGMTGATMTAAGMGGGNVSGWSQAPGMMAQQAPVGQQQVGQMMQQHLPGPPIQQSLPRPQVQPVAQQQMGVMQQGMGMQGMGMQAAAAANGNGLMVGSMNWNSAANPQPAAAASIPAPYAHLGSAVQQPLAPLNSAANTANNMQGSMGSMGRPRVDENANCWFYIDPQNQQQGPCSINQFRKWLSYLETESKYEREYQQFKSVMVWKEGSTAQTPLWTLLQL